MINIEKLGKECRIHLKNEEIENYRDDLSKIINEIDGFKKLKDIKIKRKERNTLTKLRSDVAIESLKVEDALKNTQHKKYSYYEIDQFVEEE